MVFRYLTSKSRYFPCASTLVIGLILFFQLQEPYAQTLDQQVKQILANRCTGLAIGNNIAQLGLKLVEACDIGGNNGVQTPSSAGGAAASLQGSAVSILNRVLRERLNQNDEEASAVPSRSMKFNPFGILAGAGHALSISSPFYATISDSSSSNAVFATGSQRRWNGLGFFVSGLIESLNRDITTFQDGYKSSIFGFTGGMDYRFNKKLITGLAFSYSNTDGDFRSGGNFSTHSYGGLLFASYLPTDRIFMQVTGSYTQNKYLVARPAQVTLTNAGGTKTLDTNGLASSNSNGSVFGIGLLAGYDHPVGRFSVGPRAGITYSNTRIGDYTENGDTGIELKYNAQWIHSLQSVLGVQASAAFSTRFGVLVPQFNADYIHEFANSQRLITVQFAEDFRDNPTKFQFKNDVPVRNYANLGTGLVMVWPNGWQSFVNFRAMVGNEQFNNYAWTFGLRISL